MEKLKLIIDNVNMVSNEIKEIQLSLETVKREMANLENNLSGILGYPDFQKGFKVGSFIQ